MKNKRGNIIKLIILIFAAVIIFTGCANSKQPESEKPGESEDMGDIAPDFSVELLSGETVKLSDYRGKAVFLNFWATWCGPCVGEMPDIQKLSEAFADDLIVLAINIGEYKYIVDDFIDRNNYTFSVGIDEGNQISEKYPTTGIPYTVIIDAGGIIKATHLGAKSYTVYEKDIKSALGIK